MSEDVENQNEEESGSKLREKLEAALKEKGAYAAKTAELVAQGYKYVKPEDLKDLTLDEMASKAAEIDQARDAERKDVFKSILEEKGIEEDRLEDVLSSFFTDDGDKEASDAQKRVASLNGLDGTPARRHAAADAEPGLDRIKAALS